MPKRIIVTMWPMSRSSHRGMRRAAGLRTAQGRAWPARRGRSPDCPREADRSGAAEWRTSRLLEFRL